MPTSYNEVTEHNSLSGTEEVDFFPASKVFVHSGIREAEADQTVCLSKRVKAVEVVKTLNVKVTRG